MENQIRRTFEVWKIITLGTYKNVDLLCKALKNNGNGISDWADDILYKPTFTIETVKKEVKLVNVSMADLGFKKGDRYENICAKAEEEFGLGDCPNEVSPKLRLKYKDQPKGEKLNIAMEPIINSNGCPSIFRLEHRDRSDHGHGSALWLNARNVHPNSFCFYHSRFIFLASLVVNL